MTPEETIETLEHQLAKALSACDGPSCEALLHEEFSAIQAIQGSSFEIALRDPWIAAVASCGERSLTVDDTVVSLHGDVAIVTLLISESGALSTHQSVVTDVWRRGDADWKLIERHAGGLPPARSVSASDPAA